MAVCKNPEWCQLLLDLEIDGILRSDQVRNAMLSVDRQHYVPSAFDPYVEAALPIGFGATISAPHMHATVLELLKDHLKPGAKALAVGSGSGYLTACMGFMVGPTGLVVSIDHVAQLVELSKMNVLRGNTTLLGWNNVIFKEADGRLGYPEYAPYDAIYVGAANQNIPMILIKQLAPGGRLVIPVGNLDEFQSLVQVDKSLDGTVTKKRISTVRYVPLTEITSQEKQDSRINFNETFYN